MRILKPCPFCGSKPEYTSDTFDGETTWKLGCKHCYMAETHYEPTKKEAAEVWNRRADND